MKSSWTICNYLENNFTRMRINTIYQNLWKDTKIILRKKLCRINYLSQRKRKGVPDIAFSMWTTTTKDQPTLSRIDTQCQNENSSLKKEKGNINETKTFWSQSHWWDKCYKWPKSGIIAFMSQNILQLFWKIKNKNKIL